MPTDNDDEEERCWCGVLAWKQPFEHMDYCPHWNVYCWPGEHDFDANGRCRSCGLDARL